MRIIARRTLREFYSQNNAKYADAKPGLDAWYQEAKKAEWRNPGDIKKLYKSASILKGGRVVFNIAGNKYRLIVWINYAAQIVYICFIGTHRQYDKIDAETV
ncbi:MAG: type II toxin-antitoxin system HigB family toxin [Phormidesmis sp.]